MDDTLFSSDEFLNNVIETCRDKISNDKEIFLSEDDFKFSFAQAAVDCGANNIVLEYPIMTEDLYDNREDVKSSFFDIYERKGRCKKVEEKYKRDRSFIDVHFKHREENYFVELKYKLLSVNTKKTNRPIERKPAMVSRHGRLFQLKNQGAEDLGLYDFYEDIERMENIKRIKDIENIKAFCILITNDNAYETLKNGLAEGVSLSGPETLSGNVEYQGRRLLHIENGYPIEFKVFKEVRVDIKKDENREAENNVFKILVMDLNSSNHRN